MSLNPLAQVKDYDSMLSRIFWFTTFSGTIAIWVLRRQFPWLEIALNRLDFKLEIGPIKDVTLLGYILPALLVGVLFRSIRLHDRLSDMFRIRHRFDVKNILVPLAILSGTQRTEITLFVSTFRGELMGPVFYRYASSTDPKIDKHLIYEALDWWSWYWVLLESVVVFLIASVALLFAKAWGVVLIILAGCGLAVLICMPYIKSHCAACAKREVQEILSDSERKVAVRQEMEKCTTTSAPS